MKLNVRSFLMLLLFLGCTSKEDLSETLKADTIEEASLKSLPLISINTKGNTIVDEPKVSANLTITQGDSLIETHQIGIEIRGSSSQMFDKKSYGFETWDANDEDLDASVGGFPEEEDWILYGPYSDKSLIRNVLIYQLSNAMGQYASRTDFYELKINESFLGTYVLMEKIKRDKNRVAISKNKDEDITGGYILKIDKPTGDGDWYNESFAFGSQYTVNGTLGQNGNAIFIYEYPDQDDINSAQKEYIQSYIHDFETALLAGGSDTENSYLEYIDLDSFVDFFILNEISKNPDGFRLSTFLHKDKGGKLKMGPIWDFNIAFGNVDYCNGDIPEGWAYQFNEICPNDTWLVPFWWSRFMKEEVYVSALKARWTELRGNLLSNNAVAERIEALQTHLETHNAIQNNFSKWLVLGKYVWPNAYVGNNYQDEINYLKNWVETRLNWMDNQIDTL
jgi:hypothetical protein